MSEALIITIVGGVVAIIGSILAYLGAKLSSDRARLTQVEARASRAERVNQGMWIWNRSLQDQVYKRAEPPPMDPPEWLKALLDD